jgi:hypothetical protein
VAIPAIKTKSDFFEKLPHDPFELVIKYLKGDPVNIVKSDDKTIVSFTFVCKYLNKNLRRERSEAAERLRVRQFEVLYPDDLNTLFHAHSISIGQYPLVQFNGGRDYIDYVTLRKITGITRVQDARNRVGISIPIQMPRERTSGVITLFCRHSNDPLHFRIGAGSFAITMDRFYNRQHDETMGEHFVACPTCPKRLTSGAEATGFYPILSQLLDGTEPNFRIKGVVAPPSKKPAAEDEKKDDF